MRELIVALAVILAVGRAAASEEAEVVAVVHQFLDGVNKGDTKAVLATCAAQTSIIDEFPPHEWHGATGCADWSNDFSAYNKENGITEPIATLGKPTHVDIAGDRAYVVAPATFTYKQKGKKVTESGSILTVALQKAAAGWRMTGWAWAKH